MEEATKIAVNSFGLSIENILFDLRSIDVSKTVISEICPTFLMPVRCEVSKYRTLTGMCNNLRNPSWASSRSAMARFLTPVYEDGISEPRSLAVSGQLLPNPRYISHIVHSGESMADHGITIMLTTWGQIIVHDINFGAPTFDENGDPITCCSKPASEWHPNCYAFDVPHNDTFYTMFNRSCINFVRLTPSLKPNCPLGPREPMNAVSGFLDGSVVYGSSTEESNELRENVGGRLKSHSLHRDLGLKDLLPSQTKRPDFLCHRQTRPKNAFCFMSGDVRTNQQLPLTLVHTILMREHNRIAGILSESHPDLDDETLFEESRRILVAEMQVITYREFLPILLGDRYSREYDLTLLDEGYYDGYDSKINAEARVAFQAAAFRFGHSIVPDVIKRYNQFNQKIGTYRMSHLLRSPFELYKPGIMDTFILGLINQEANRMDAAVTTELTNHLFATPGRGFGSDLAAINIMRGREMGLPPYNAFREFCGLYRPVLFSDLVGIMGNQTIKKLAQVYDSVEDIDLWTGGVSEFPVRGAVVGPTFACIISQQFSFLRRGDRFWYENRGFPSSFSPNQLQEIRKANLGRMICDNSDDIAMVQTFPMLPADEETNPRTPCTRIQGMDLTNFLTDDIVTLRLSKK